MPTLFPVEDEGESLVETKRKGLLPNSPQNPIHIKRPDGVTESQNTLSRQSSKKISPTELKLKVRILTWNMHDSLPNGELDELLGRVPPYHSRTAQSEYFPNLSNDANHPYHLVVIAGQECPTPSGIPKGLGAGFKLLDKERDKLKDSDEGLCTRPIKNKGQYLEVHRSEKHTSLENLSLGWTSIVEDWLCNGGIAVSRMKTPSTASIGFPQPLIRQKFMKGAHKSPYRLLIKERLMGIYMAIYIHRDLKSSVQGMSKSVVAAGLIGGRVGNKGGVGISLKLAGTTLLFLNAHLAAHEGKIHHRVANLQKIKAELDVDTFLSNNDPRMMAEDLTDKFDFTFLCGDLNFRLDVSRLHADWLISRREYAQALEFDQLKVLMKQGTVLNGFNEGIIDFPPTFKYDVLRTSKRSKLQTSQVRLDPAGNRSTRLTELEERDIEETEEEDVGGASLASSMTTSFNSRPTIEPGMQEGNYFQPLPATPPTATSSNKPSALLNVADRAKAKCLTLLSPLSPSFAAPPSNAPKGKQSNVSPQTLSPPSPLRIFHTGLSSDPSFDVIPNEDATRRFLRPSPLSLVDLSDSGFITEELQTEDKGVYDSSHKRRVPSWCDRILWKTTVIPDPVPPNEEVILDSSRPQTRVSQFMDVFRSSSRTLPDSSAPKPSALSSSYVVSGNHANEDPSSRSSPLPLAHAPRSIAFDSSFSKERPHSASVSKWRFLPAFLSPTSPQSNEHPGIPVQSTYTKGDIVCLNYNTLDDREMRRLEGRSDHRPVIGAYVISL